jgi:Protein of unknown function (DUF3237)
MSARLPDPSPTRVYRLEATRGEPLDLGDLAQGRRRIVPLTGGTFTGPELNGKLPGSSADWQTVLPDGTALGDIRYTLETDEGDLLYVQSRSMRHGSADVLVALQIRPGLIVRRRLGRRWPVGTVQMSCRPAPGPRRSSRSAW